MLISYKFSVVALNLLLLMHIAHTFVLLTANMEDVQRIARKFVSDSVAYQIADFITKATESMMNNASEGSQGHQAIRPLAQENSHEVSEENNKYNVAKRGTESAAQDTIKSAEEVVEKAKESSSSEEINQDTETTTKDSEKLLIGNPYQSHSRYISSDTKQTKKVTNEEEGSNKSIYTENNLEATEGKKPKKKVKYEKYNRLPHSTSVEDNRVAENIAIDNRTTPDDFPENEKFQKRALEDEMVPTKNEGEEYDHYESRKVLATSGPMSLLMARRRFGPENWWEKELPKPDTPQIPEG